MKYFITLIACCFLAGCGDKDNEDTSSDTAEAADTSNSSEE
jgi:hypothetical protein